MIDQSREQWLKDTQDYFREIQSYNTTIITVGYATFFGLLFFLQDKVHSQLLFWAGLFVALSAAIFVVFELINNIKLALDICKAGAEGKRFFRYWAFFFILSVLLAVAGSALLVYLFLCKLGA
jgi:glycosyltransferase involved in cell wall biosynthesis